MNQESAQTAPIFPDITNESSKRDIKRLDLLPPIDQEETGVKRKPGRPRTRKTISKEKIMPITGESPPPIAPAEGLGLLPLEKLPETDTDIALQSRTIQTPACQTVSSEDENAVASSQPDPLLPHIVLNKNKITEHDLVEVYDYLASLSSGPVTFRDFDVLMRQCVKEIHEHGYKSIGYKNLKDLLVKFKTYFEYSLVHVPGEAAPREIVERLDTPLGLRAEAAEPETAAETKPKKKTAKAKTAAESEKKLKDKPLKHPQEDKPGKAARGRTAKGTKSKTPAADTLTEPQEPREAAAGPEETVPASAQEAAGPPLPAPVIAAAETGAFVNQAALKSSPDKPGPLAEVQAGDQPSAVTAAAEKAEIPNQPAAGEKTAEEISAAPSGGVLYKVPEEPPAAAQPAPPEADLEQNAPASPQEPPQTGDGFCRPQSPGHPSNQPYPSYPAAQANYRSYDRTGSGLGWKEDPAASARFRSQPDLRLAAQAELRSAGQSGGDPRQIYPGGGTDYSVPINIPTSGVVTEVNLDRHIITVREDITGQFFSGYVQASNVSWTIIRTLFERGEPEIKVDFQLRPNTETTQIPSGTPVVTDVKYYAIDDMANRGLSVWYHDVIYMPKISSGHPSAHPTFEQMLERLAECAQPEKWYFHDNRKPFNLLENYFLKTFQNLQKEKINKFLDIFFARKRVPELLEVNDAGLAFSADYQLAALNTGLLDQGSRDILVVFKKTDPSQKRYVFKGFTSQSDNALGKEVATRIFPRPVRTSYYQKSDDVIYKNIPIDLDHDAQCNHIIIDGIRRGRFPSKFISLVCPPYFRYAEDNSRLKADEVEATNSELAKFIEEESNLATYTTLKEKLKTALDLTLRKIVTNPRIPLPFWNPAQDKLAFILPLALADPRDYDVALVVEQISDTDGGAIRPFIHTVLTLSMACKGARLISTLQDTWLGSIKDKHSPIAAMMPKADFPARLPQSARPPLVPPPPKRLKSPSLTVPNLTPKIPKLPAGPRPPIRPAGLGPAPAVPAPVRKPISFQEIRMSFPDEIRCYASGAVNELNADLLLKIFDFCVRTSNRPGERAVPLQVFHEVLTQVVPRLTPENGGYSGFNSNYIDLTAVLELNRKYFVLRKNRTDRVKYIFLQSDLKDSPLQTVSSPPGPQNLSAQVSEPPQHQGTVVGPVLDKNNVTIIDDDGTERKARVRDIYDMYLINKLLASDYPGVDVTYYCNQVYSRSDVYDSTKRGYLYEVSDVHLTEIDPDLRAVLNTSFPSEFYQEMVNKLREDTGYNPLYQYIFGNLRMFFTHCLEMRKYLALNKLLKRYLSNNESRPGSFLSTYSDIFLMQGFTEMLSQNSIGFNLNLQTVSGMTIFATFHRGTTSETFFRFAYLNNFAANGPEVYSTGQLIAEKIKSVLPPPAARLNLTLTDESAWSRLIWFGSEHGIIPPDLAADPEGCRFNMSRAFQQSADDFTDRPQEALLAWDSVDKTYILILPITLSLHGPAEMAVGFRFSSSRSNGLISIDPTSIRLFSLPEAYLRAQVVRPVEGCWLTQALLTNRPI
jgi:hypothetical protein